jgi:hypothetical protein
MDEGRQAQIDYFLKRIAYRRSMKRDETTAGMLAARDADHAHPRVCSGDDRRLGDA